MPTNDYPYREIDIALGATADFKLARCIDAAYAEMDKNIRQQLYADDNPLHLGAPTLRSRFKIFLERARDAWLVLRGKAEIGY